MEGRLLKWLKKGGAVLVCIMLIFVAAPLNAEAGFVSKYDDIVDPTNLREDQKISKIDFAKVNGAVATYKMQPTYQYTCPTNRDYVVNLYILNDDNSWTEVRHTGIPGLYETCVATLDADTSIQDTDCVLYNYDVNGVCTIYIGMYTSKIITVIDENTTITLPDSIEGVSELDPHNPDDPYGSYNMLYELQAVDIDNNSNVTCARDYSREATNKGVVKRETTLRLGDYMDPSVDYFELNTEFFAWGGFHSVTHYFVTKDKLSLVGDGYMSSLSAFTLEGNDGLNISANSYLADGRDGNWYLYSDGKINRNYTGLFCDANVGWWLVQNGRVAFEYNDLYGDANYGWWKITNGAVDFGYSDLYCSPTYGWWLVYNGAVNFNYNGLAQNEYGWWCIQNGAVDFGRTGLVYDPYVGWWYVQNGAINFNYNGLVYDPYVGWWVVSNGAVNFGYTGMIQNEYGWWYAVNGALDFNATGWACNEYGWWLYYNGTIAWNYTGWWDGFYCVNGHLAQ